MDNYPQERVVFTVKASCLGVIITTRGEGDNHLCFFVIVEDDGNWNLCKNGASTFWLPELLDSVKNALVWLEHNATRGQWGWELKR